MTQEEIEGNNRLIAEFMGMQETKLGWYDAEKVVFLPAMEVIFEFLDFHVDWNWLMSVVEQIEELEEGKYGVSLLQDGVIITDWKNQKEIVRLTLAEVDLGKRIDFTYRAAVEFIKWYSENK